MTSSDVLARLASVEPETRRRAVEHLGELDPPEVADALRRALADEDWRVRKEAARVAARISPRAVALRVALGALADRDDVGLRNAAVEALVHIGPDAVPGAASALRELDADGRKLAVEVLAGAPTVLGMRALTGALDDPDANVVAAAAEALGRAALAGDEAVEVAGAGLLHALERDDTGIRIAVLDALASLDVVPPFAVLESFVRDPLLRRAAVAALGGHASTPALAILVEASADSSTSTSRAAIAALGRSLESMWHDERALDDLARLVRAATGAHAQLRAAAEDASDPEVRAGGLLALGALRDPDDVARLVEALDDDDVGDRAEAALERHGAQAVAPLVDRGRTAAPPLRGRTLSMLPVLDRGEPETTHALRAALADPSPEVVAPALKSLALLADVADFDVVLAHLGSADPRVAGAARSTVAVLSERFPEAARAALGRTKEGTLSSITLRGVLAELRLASQDDVTALQRALAHEDPALRKAAASALGATGAPSAVAAVTLALTDEDDGVAQAAIRALGRLGASDTLAALAAQTRDPARLAVVLRALGDADRERAIAAARPLVLAASALVSEAAIDVIASSGWTHAAATLAEATRHPDLEVVKLALARLATLEDEAALMTLVGALAHPSADVRRCAVELLGQKLPLAEASAALHAQIEREADPLVRRAVMDALASFSQRGARDERMRAP